MDKDKMDTFADKIDKFEDNFIDSPTFSDKDISDKLTEQLEGVHQLEGEDDFVSVRHNTFRDTRDFKQQTVNRNKNMFGGCKMALEVFVQKENKCFPMDHPTARRAMIRMLRRKIDPSQIKTPNQKTGTCWFYAALTAMFLSDLGRVNNVPLRESMILGRKGYKTDAEPVGYYYVPSLRVLNQTIHVLLDGVATGTEGTAEVTFTELQSNQAKLRGSEKAVSGLKQADDENLEIRWRDFLDDNNLRYKFWDTSNVFHNLSPLAFMEGVAKLTSQIPIEKFRSISHHDEPIPSTGDFTTVIRYGTAPFHESATEEGRLRKSLGIGLNNYVLDAMVLTSDLFDTSDLVEGGGHHATSCIHLGGTRYWFDSNDHTRPEPYDWYELLDGKEAKRKLGDIGEIYGTYSMKRLPSILIYQKSKNSWGSRIKSWWR